MDIKAMVTIDLHGASDKERKEFYKHLEDEGWSKIPHVTTAWEIEFPSEYDTRRKALDAIKNDFENARKVSGIKNATAAMKIGNSSVIIIT